MLSMLLVPAAVQAEPPVQKIAQPKTIEEFSARSLGETEPEHGGAGPGPAENYAFDAPKNGIYDAVECGISLNKGDTSDRNLVSGQRLRLDRISQGGREWRGRRCISP